MHIPDGFVSPATCITSAVIALPILAYAVKKTKERMLDNAQTFSTISTLTAFSFVLMMFNIPIPGGTSGHAVGAAILAILFGPLVGALCISIVLFIQALVFGDGGLFTFGLNALAMGIVGSYVGYYTYKLLCNKVNENISLFIAGWASIVCASVVVSIALGIQPLIANENGQPLFFPFGLEATIPAVVGAHMLAFGFIDGIATVLVVKFARKTNTSLQGESV